MAEKSDIQDILEESSEQDDVEEEEQDDDSEEEEIEESPIMEEEKTGKGDKDAEKRINLQNNRISNRSKTPQKLEKKNQTKETPNSEVEKNELKKFLLIYFQFDQDTIGEKDLEEYYKIYKNTLTIKGWVESKEQLTVVREFKKLKEDLGIEAPCRKKQDIPKKYIETYNK